MATKLLAFLKLEPEMTAELQELQVLLQWVKFSGLPDETCTSLLRSHLLVALRQEGFDVPDKIGKKIAYTEVPMAQSAFMQSAIDTLEKNAEELGGKPVKDWVSDYYNFRAIAALRSSLDEVNYVNQSSFAKGLNQEDRTLLLAILKITDSLKNALQQLQAPVAVSQQGQLPEDFDYSTLIPGIIRPQDLANAPALDVILDADDTAVPPVTAPAQPKPVLSSPPAVSRPTPPPLRTARAAPVQQTTQQREQQAPPTLPVAQNPTPVAASPAAASAPKPQIPEALQSVRRPIGASVNMQDILNSQGKQRG
jgi:hypothetical protein